MKTEIPYKESFFHSCLCGIANTVMILAMVLIGLRFQHAVPHYETPRDKEFFEIREAETERREENIEDEDNREQNYDR